jgi:cytochrome c biogenesis protein CcmG/thiol:disulfide interchange protein DsbE
MAKNKNLITIVVTAVVVLAIGYVFISASDDTAVAGQNETQAVSQQKGKADDQQFPEAPDFQLTDLEDKVVSLSDYKGNVVFVNFWATWCGPCRMEIPHFVELIDEYGDDGFVVLGIALDPREFDKVPGFSEQMGINYPVLYDKSGVSNLYGGIRSIPTTFVVNREGKIVDRIVGSRPKAEFERIVTTHL